jgi:hypothetical protein
MIALIQVASIVRISPMAVPLSSMSILSVVTISSTVPWVAIATVAMIATITRISSVVWVGAISAIAGKSAHISMLLVAVVIASMHGSSLKWDRVSN